MLSYELCNKDDWQPRPSLVNQLNQTSFACRFDFGTVTKYKRRFKKEPAIYRNKDAVYSGMNSECLWIEQLEKKQSSETSPDTFPVLKIFPEQINLLRKDKKFKTWPGN